MGAKRRSVLRRKPLRLPGYDYAHPGAYFLTICSHRRLPLFGEAFEDRMRLNAFGQAVQACWAELPQHFPHVELDAFIVMPNHVHGVILIHDLGRQNAAPENVGATHASPLPKRASGPRPRSLASIAGSLKSAATRRINQLRGTPGAPVWQRNYYEHIIRDEAALNRIRAYIQTNPQRWHFDVENPARLATDDFDQWLRAQGGRPLAKGDLP